MACKGGSFLQDKDSCTYKEGALPSCAPLAVPMLAAQPCSEPAYDSADALAKGTLFPGLDLPFMDYVAAGPVENTPQAELMALDFVCQELALPGHPSRRQGRLQDLEELQRPGQGGAQALRGDVRPGDARRHGQIRLLGLARGSLALERRKGG